MCVCIAGFAILLAVYDKAHRKTEYAALFLIAMGAYSAMPVVVCWFNMNLGELKVIHLSSKTLYLVISTATDLDLGGHHRRAVGSAWQVGYGNTGGIIAVYAFLAKDAPRYIPGYSICLAFVCLSMISCIIYLISIMHANRTRDRSARDIGLTETEKTEMGDLSPDYRYLL